MEFDNIHYSFTTLDGHNKPFNFVISPREDGKTTSFIRKSWKAFLNGYTTIILKRMIANITDDYIRGIEGILRKFGFDVTLSFKLGEIKEGVVSVYAQTPDMDKKRLYLKIIALNVRTDQLKSLFIENPAYMFLDELILQPHSKQDKYLEREAWKMCELYNTYRRENIKLKFYACGNPYSMYNPYFVFFGIDPATLKYGTITTGEIWAVERHALHPDLVAKLKKENPLYNERNGDAFDSYTKYALNGEAVGDSSIKICKQRPEGFKLFTCFRYEGSYIGVYKGEHDNFTYWAGQIKDEGTRREVFAFSFNDLVEGSALFSIADKIKFAQLRMAIANRNIAFDGVESNYQIQEVYKHL